MDFNHRYLSLPEAMLTKLGAFGAFGALKWEKVTTGDPICGHPRLTQLGFFFCYYSASTFDDIYRIVSKYGDF